MTHECTWSERSPVGTVTISAADTGVRSVTLRSRARNGAPCPACRPISAAFRRYFAGDGSALESLPVDLSGASSAFYRRVYQTLRRLAPPGTTTSYGELAAAAGHPGAARAVGSAMARNPVPLVVPCHRVLEANGGLGGYGGGVARKRFLLRLEGATPLQRR